MVIEKKSLEDFRVMNLMFWGGVTPGGSQEFVTGRDKRGGLWTEVS